MFKADGFDEAILGVSIRAGMEECIVYDYEKCVEILMERDGMSHGEATEFMSFNVIGAHMGKGTPVFSDKMPLKAIEDLYSDEIVEEAEKEDRTIFRCDGCDNENMCFLQVPIEEAEIPKSCPYNQKGHGTHAPWEHIDTLRDKAWWDGGKNG